MSILNVFVSRHLAAVAVDTDAAAQNGTFITATKMFPFFHINAVLAGRGTPLFNSILAMGLGLTDGDFDAIADRMPGELLPKAWLRFREFSGRVGLENADGTLVDGAGADIAFVGWSKRERRMIGYAYIRKARDDDFSIQEIDSWMVGPQDGSIPWPKAFNNTVLRQLAMEQVRLIERIAPASSAGGTLIVAEILPDQLLVKTAGELPRVRSTNNGEQ